MAVGVTVHINRNHYYNSVNPFRVGELTGIAGKKRFYLQVCDVSKEPYQHTITTVVVYKPAPKSRLNRKVIFSKIKFKIV